ncbi:MAG: single-stranded DNA-binding protein [Mycoplasmoidaceae bacterium]|nr:single-stranded DNA-binding protein [Mycoplasmoidaceae bacterium]
MNSFLKKGDLVAIDGELRRTSFVSKQSGQTVYSTDIVINSINSLGSKKQNNEFAQASVQAEPNKSIDEAFATKVVTNAESSKQKIETPRFNNNDEIE